MFKPQLAPASATHHRKDIAMRISTLTVLLATVVVGCTVGPDYERPAVDAPTAWRIEYVTAAEVANTRWWEQFGDQVLN